MKKYTLIQVHLSLEINNPITDRNVENMVDHYSGENGRDNGGCLMERVIFKTMPEM